MNEIHSTVIISGDVKLGKNNIIHPYTTLTGPLEIGDGNIIGPHAVIGSPGANTKNPFQDASKFRIKIGNRNIIREYVAIQKACFRDITLIGNETFLMQGVSVSHDVILEDKTCAAANAVLAGTSRILEGANIAMGACVNQYSVVGQYSIVAAAAASLRHVKPFSRFIPGKPPSVNEYAIKKYGFNGFESEIAAYVLENQRPTSERILKVVERFEAFCRESGHE